MSEEIVIKHFEFWSPRIFETPYYIWLLLLCVRHRLRPAHLAKANFALDHGEIGLGSKYKTQMAFPQCHFPATELLGTEADGRTQIIEAFAAKHGWPLIMKPDNGAVGKGVVRLDSIESAANLIAELEGRHLIQAYCDLQEEFGVFYVRINGVHKITGINQKHFPTVIGDGTRCLAELAKAHPRYTSHWALFLKYLDLNHVPPAGESVRLSFVGSHTMGCKFTDDSELVTQALLDAIVEVCEPQAGFNFGRLDVRAASRESLQAGEFVVIEVNGAASLPTHMFDPQNSLLKGYKIFLKHGTWLARIAAEHRSEPMELMSLREVWERVVFNQRQLNQVHQQVLDGKTAKSA